MGTSPRASDSTFWGTMSRAQTWWPSSAKQAAVTRPTQPTPMTPIGSFVSATRPSRLQSAHGAGDGKHLLLVQGEQEGVRDPVDGPRRAPRDQAQAVAVVGQLVGAPADLAGLGDPLEDRRGPPRGGPGA